MDIGLNTSEDAYQLRQALAAIESVTSACEKLPDDPAFLTQHNNDLRRIIDQLPEPQVDVRLTIRDSLLLARGSLSLVHTIITDNRLAITPTVLPVLLRSALLGAGRVLYMLGPENEPERVANTRNALKQEAESYGQAYKQFADFEVLVALVPPADLVKLYEGRRVDLAQDGRPPGEAKTLDSMAEVLGTLLATAEAVQPELGTDADAKAVTSKEHIRWIFHIYSGIAHGYAWPWLTPGTQSLPGHFIADLTMIANIAHLAADTTLRRADIT